MTAALEDAKIISFEEWGSLATAPSPTKLKQGLTPNAKNVWVDEKPGSVITANGYLKVGEIPSGNPVTFCINYFRSSVGTQTFVVSDNSTVWITTDFQTFTSIITGLSSNFQLRGLVIRDKLWLTNGSDPVYIYNGTTATILDGTAGTPNVPRGRYIAYHDERVWLYHIVGARSQAAFSALTDSSGTIIAPDNASAWPSSNTLQISEGDADYGTGMILYRGYLYFFKQYTIWRLAGYDEYSYTRVKTRASTGTRFSESLQILDSLVHLIGVDGMYIFDGEETERISDLIDPATASQTSFGFNQLQQPNSNAQFWEVSSTADFNAGTVSDNLRTTGDQIALAAVDDSQSDFQNGVTQTNLDLTTEPSLMKLSLSSSGESQTNIALNQSTILTALAGSTIGQGGLLTDGSTTNTAGFNGTGAGGHGTIEISLLPGYNVTTVFLYNVFTNGGGALFYADNVLLIPSSVSSPASLTGSQVNWPNTQTRNYTVTFPVFTAAVLKIELLMPPNVSWTSSEIQVFTAAYNSTGKFVSRTLDLHDFVSSPATALGTFHAVDTVNGEGIVYFTQTSDDGITWDGEVAVANGSDIGSVPRRYIRWGADFTSDGNRTPSIDSAFLPAAYISPIHDTGGSIFAWGPFESTRTLPSQLRYYYRTATTLAGVSTATWNLIVPGGVLTDPVINSFVQFKIEFANGDNTHLPVISDVTINWVKGTGVQVAALQNVASAVWRNRYWMAAAGPSATANDTILIRGKKPFGSPWQLKDFPFLSFTRFQDSLYAGSSVDGSIFKVDTGYSKNGDSIDSYFETGDFITSGFYSNPMEVLVEVERKGPYNMVFGFSINRGNTWTDYNIDLTLSAFATSFTKKINLASTNTDRIRFRVRTNGVDQPFEVHRFIYYYKIESSRGSIQ